MTRPLGLAGTGDAVLESASAALKEFALSFLPPDEQGQANIFLKLDHCLRVFQEAQAIVQDEAMAADTARTALWAALFHDIGRFPQYARYATFDDRKSTNHARLGVRVLKREGLLQPLPLPRQKAVLAAVILHNRRFLPPGLPEGVAVPAKVVRDADKLDILAVMLEHLRPGAPRNKVVTLGLRDDPAAYTQAVIDQIMAGRLADYGDMIWFNDFRLLLCSWIYDFHFAASRNALRQRCFVEELLAELPDTREIRRAAAKIRMDLAAG